MHLLLVKSLLLLKCSHKVSVKVEVVNWLYYATLTFKSIKF